MHKNQTKFSELLVLAFKAAEQKWVSVERKEIEKRIAVILMSLYAESEYKSLVAATAIVDLMIDEEVILVNIPQIKQGDA